MEEYIQEPARTLTIRDNYDVVVAGGGIAGVAAAVAAARNGAKTCLLEKEYALGGLATLGLVVAYLPLCDGMGHLISTGIAEELLLLTTVDGSGQIPECWQSGGSIEERKKKRYFLEYNAASYILELEKWVISNGVDLLYDTRIVGTHSRENLLDAVIIESKSGRQAIGCKGVVDATGDADVCFLSGEKTISLATNSASGWYYSTSLTGNRLHKLFKPFSPSGGTPGNDQRGYSGDSPEEVTAHFLDSRNLIREHIAELRKKESESAIYPFLIPTFPCFRMTRRLEGEIVPDAEDRLEYSDSIGLIGNWRKAGPVYSIPLRALRGVKKRNLFTAGRCISMQGQGWDLTRVIPSCSVTGEAAGTAAALYRQGSEWDVEDLQKNLLQQNMNIKLDQISGLVF